MGRAVVGENNNDRQPALSREQRFRSETERILAAEVDDLKQIHRLSLRLAGADTLANLLLDVLRTATGLVDARLGSVQLLTPQGELGMIGQTGFGDGILDQFAVVNLDGCSTCAAALKRRARVVVPDLRTNSDFTEIADAFRSYGAVGAVSTPVLDKAGDVLAMFSVYWLEEHEPNERELRALDLCAELAGRHVERGIAAEALLDHNRRQSLLMRELAHRGKNLLAVIQAIAARSLSGERTVNEAREIFIGRLGALSDTYNILTDETSESAQLHDIVWAALRSHGERVRVDGPTIVVPARYAQTLALVIHELATNSAKYGALSTPSGVIEAKWQITNSNRDGERFSLDWTEIGGPPAEPPAQRGFGSVIITSVIGKELKCVPATEYGQSGFRYHLDCELNALVDKSAENIPSNTARHCRR